MIGETHANRDRIGRTKEVLISRALRVKLGVSPSTSGKASISVGAREPHLRFTRRVLRQERALENALFFLLSTEAGHGRIDSRKAAAEVISPGPQRCPGATGELFRCCLPVAKPGVSAHRGEAHSEAREAQPGGVGISAQKAEV